MDALPVELISTIFEWAVSEPSTRHRTVRDISYLNRRLREVALASPLIWSTIDVGKDRPSHLALRSLERSKACPLDITIQTGHLAPSDAAETVRTICHHLSRWSSFRLDASGPTENLVQETLRRLFGALNGRAASLLEKFEVVAPKGATLESQIVLEHVMAPRLRSLTLRNVGLDWSARFPGLRDLTLIGIGESAIISFENISAFLQTARELETVVLIDISLPPSDQLILELVPSMIQLPNLTSLNANNIPFDFLHRLLTSLDSPNLRKLRLGASVATMNLDWSTITTSSLKNVQEFELVCPKELPADADAIRAGALYEALFRNLPNARTVRMSSVAALGRLVSATLLEPELQVLPHMNDLECHGMKGCGLSSLVSLVEGRAAVGSERLSRLSISARDFSTTASIGQRSLQAADEAMEALKRGVAAVELRERQDHCAFRYTFLGWKDYMAHQSGRRIEYDQAYEE